MPFDRVTGSSEELFSTVKYQELGAEGGIARICPILNYEVRVFFSG
jgi:hypothetical protein